MGAGLNYLIDRKLERNVIERKLLLEKFPSYYSKRIITHPRGMQYYKCENCTTILDNCYLECPCCKVEYLGLIRLEEIEK